MTTLAAPSRSRFLISESALKLSLTPAPSATPTGSVSSASSASSTSSSSFAVRRKQFRPTSVPADPAQPRVHSESESLVSLGIVLVVSGAGPDPYVRRALKRPFRAVDREPKDRDGPPREQPRYRPPPPDVPLPARRRLRPTHALSRNLPLYHPSRPLRELPPLPTPVDIEAIVPEPQATRTSGRTRRPPPRNLEHLIVAVSNTARTRERERDKDKERNDRDRERSPAKKRKVVVLATDEMDIDVEVPSPAPEPAPAAPAPAESGRPSSRSAASKKKAVALEPTPMLEDTPPVEDRSSRRVTRRGKDISVTPTPPPFEPAKEAAAPKSQSSRAPARKSRPSKTGSEGDSTPAATPVPTPAVTRRTSARKSGGGDSA